MNELNPTKVVLHKGIVFNPSSKKYYTQFYNPVQQKREESHGFDSPNEAEVEYIRQELKFHTENKGFLPKGITLVKSTGKYHLQVRNLLKGKTGMKYLFSSYDLEEVKRARQLILKGLLDI